MLVTLPFLFCLSLLALGYVPIPRHNLTTDH